MLELGLQIIPTMPVPEILALIRTAEEIGYRYCVVADEGFMPDVYVLLGIAAQQTSHIKLGPVTNGYTRHPAVTATAAATLNEVAEGRAIVNLVAGGSMVLRPMAIPREAPLTVMRETIAILRQLWSGERGSYEGKRYQIDSAQVALGAQEIPVWLSVRGPKLLKLGGQQANGVVMTGKSDLDAALKIVGQGASQTGNQPTRIYLDRVAYTPELLNKAAFMLPYAVMDSPPRLLYSMGLSDEQIEQIRMAFRTGGVAEAAKLITPEMIKNYVVSGTPQECSDILKTLISDHQLDIFMLNLNSPGIAANTRLLADIAEIVKAAE